MIKAIQILNLTLALALAGLCAFQWKREKGYNDRIKKLQKSVNEQKVRIDSDSRTIKELEEDNTAFKSQITTLEAANREQENVIRTNSTQLAKIERENETLKVSLEAWKKGVQERDERLNTQNDMLKKLGEQRADLANRLKDAVTRHNEVVKELNAARGATNAPAAPPK